MKSIFSIFTKSTDSFEGQEKDENVIMLIRRHPLIIFFQLSSFAFLLLIPLVVIIVFSSFLSSNNLLTVLFFIASVWYLFLWSSAFYLITLYTLDVWIITDRRIIDSAQKGFFHRKVSELHISRIQDVSVTTQGVLQTFLKFGDLQIQTAGTEERFKFIQIANPEGVKDTIMKLVHPSLSK